jgi:hypothetical protein
MDIGMFQSQRVVFVFLTLYALLGEQFWEELACALFSFSEMRCFIVIAGVFKLTSGDSCLVVVEDNRVRALLQSRTSVRNRERPSNIQELQAVGRNNACALLERQCFDSQEKP